MSYCKEEGNGKDRIIFATQDDLSSPSKAMITVDEDDEDEPAGILLPNGEINWDCPCLGGMPSGPCGVQFREAFTCFHNSKEEEKGIDCYDKFLEFNSCLQKHPELYSSVGNEGDEELGKELDQALEKLEESQSNDTDNSSSSPVSEKDS